MSRYYSTFITGFEDIIEPALRRQLKNVSIPAIFDGGIVFESQEPPGKIAGLRFFNNSYLLLHSIVIRGIDPIGDMMKSVLRTPSVGKTIARNVRAARGTFRVIASMENQLVTMDNRLLEQMEAFLAGVSHLSVNRGKPDLEFWILSRSEGYVLFGLRITRHRDYAKTLERGELRPELCHILCLISNPSATDIFLDPFCGSGAIPIERARSFAYRVIQAGDIDGESVARLRRKAQREGLNVMISTMDATSISSLQPRSVDKIVTDPPWGLYLGQRIDIESLYRGMLEEFTRLLRVDGVAVVVVANKDMFERIAEDYEQHLRPVRRFDTLVSGKKAGVYKLVRTDC
jgi:tRNA G10  N-methylase Trm11